MEQDVPQTRANSFPPAVLRKISEIQPADERVSVYCTVIENGEMEQRVDDGTGQAVIVFDDPSLFEKSMNLKVIRVFGKPFKEGPHQIIAAEVVQDMSKLDTELLRKVYG